MAKKGTKRTGGGVGHPNSLANLENRISGNPHGGARTRQIFKHIFENISAMEIDPDRPDGVVDRELYDAMKDRYPEVFKATLQAERPSLMVFATMRLYHEALFSDSPTAALKEIFDRLLGRPDQKVTADIHVSPIQQMTDDELDQLEHLTTLAIEEGQGVERSDQEGEAQTAG